MSKLVNETVEYLNGTSLVEAPKVPGLISDQEAEDIQDLLRMKRKVLKRDIKALEHWKEIRGADFEKERANKRLKEKAKIELERQKDKEELKRLGFDKNMDKLLQMLHEDMGPGEWHGPSYGEHRSYFTKEYVKWAKKLVKSGLKLSDYQKVRKAARSIFGRRDDE